MIMVETPIFLVKLQLPHLLVLLLVSPTQLGYRFCRQDTYPPERGAVSYSCRKSQLRNRNDAGEHPPGA